MTSRITQTIATQDQRNSIAKLIENAFLTKEDLEKIVDRICEDAQNVEIFMNSIDELQHIRHWSIDFIRSISDASLYADQVVSTQYGYSGYRQARPIDEQIRILQNYDWNREIDWKLNEVQQQLINSECNKDAEGYFVVVFDEVMVTCFEDSPIIDQSAPLIRVLNMLSEQRNGYVMNYKNGEFHPTHYRRTRKSANMMRRLWEYQQRPTGIMIIPAQMGLKYAGHSVLRSRVMMRGQEFPLDAYEVLQMVLTHSNRIRCYDDLWIDLPGSQFSPHADGTFGYALYIGFENNLLEFVYYNAGHSAIHSGSASGFLPQ